eukprot:scaffold323_cov232-Pinguiococcus_pyrenoidosus.AAC.3
MSFGIRNVEAEKRPQVFAEAHRVLRESPESQLAIMEFAEPREGVMGILARAFVRYLVPAIGFVGSGDAAAYQHLQKSIGSFPSPDDFQALLAGPDPAQTYHFEITKRRALLFGVVQIYIGRPVPIGLSAEAA